MNPQFWRGLKQIAGRYFGQWRRLSAAARLYLLHAALLTSSLAIYGLFFNLAILSLGYPRLFLGQLNGLSIAVAAILSLPLWWLVTRIGLKRALLLSASLQALSAIVIALWPTTAPLLIAVAFTGAAATIFQVSSPPFMMEHSDDATRDYLFSANMAVNVGLAGIATFFAGQIKAQLSVVLGVASESTLAYRATFGVAGVGILVSVIPLLFIARSAHVLSARTSEPPKRAANPTLIDEQAATIDDERASWLDRVPYGARIIDRLPPNVQRLTRQPQHVLALLVSPMLISFGAALLIQYLNLFFKERFPIDDIMLGHIFALLGIATGIAALIGPAISTRIGKLRTIVLTQVLSIPFLLLLGFVPILQLAVGAALVRGALFNMGSPLYDAFAMERTEEAARPVVIGLINGAYTVGYLISPLISTWVQARYGFAPLFVATASFYGLAALANYLLFIRRPTRLRHARSERSARESA